MGRTDAPCYGCGERAAGCHGRCERYRAFRAGVDERNQARYEEMMKRPQMPMKEKAVVRALKRRRRR